MPILLNYYQGCLQELWMNIKQAYYDSCYESTD